MWSSNAHAELCVHILEHWNFPPELTRAAGRHHDYAGASLTNADIAVEPREVALSHIVCLANEMAKAQGYAFAGRPALDLTAMTAAEYLGLDDSACTEIGEAMETAYQETEEHFRA